MGTDRFHLTSPKKLTQENEDKISSLPDKALCRILSRLTTKQAVATTVLSTRWKDVFALIPDLNFDDDLRRSDVTFSAFVTNVIRALLAKSTKIRKFRIDCMGGIHTASLVSSWVSSALLGDLQDLYLCVRDLTNPVLLPPQLFHCKTLTELQLRGNFSFCVPNDVCFPNLKSLVLFNLVLTDNESVKRFFHGCIVLESLTLLGCVMNTISVLEVSVASLKQLDLCSFDGDYELVLDAPLLEDFECGSYAARGYSGERLNSLESARIDIGLPDEHFDNEKVSQLVNMVSNARSLSLGGDSLKPFVNLSTTFQNLTDLRVSTIYASGWLSLPNLLENAPCLKVLSFNEGLHDEFGNYPELASYLPETVPACVSAQLKEVEVRNFQGEEDEFKMVEYFLKNAEVLEKMTITLGPDDIDDYFPVARRLLEIPRCSRACRLVFIDEDE